jgi:glycosyltransferase involved in cell wall biosynthesis
MKRPALSVCIITFNEEQNIRDCLESVAWVDEIIVVDSFSQDTTVSLCRMFTEKVYEKEWQGHVKQKNCALQYASNEWVLCIDADERVSTELREEIERNLSMEGNSCDGYYFLRHSYYLGKWINHGGWYPDYKLRLFKKSKGRWGGQDPHDKVILKGTTTQLKGELLHFVYKNVSHQLQTVDTFSTITATALDREGDRFNLFKLLYRPSIKFFETYCIKRGFMDGLPGFIIAITSSFYVFIRYVKLWELQKQRQKDCDTKAHE